MASAQVELGRLHLGAEAAGLQPGKPSAAPRPSGACSSMSTWMRGEWPRLPLRPQLLHQPLEGQLLVFVRAQRRLPHPPQHFAEGGLAGQVRPQHQRVDEEADQPLQLAARCARRWCVPTTRSSLPLYLRQQHLEGGQSTMNSVAPSPRPRACSRSSSSADPRGWARAPRGTPARRAAGGPWAAPAAPARRPAAPSSTPAAAPAPRPAAGGAATRRSRAYCTGSSGRGDSPPSRYAW